MRRIQLITCVICVLALIGTTGQAPAQIPQTMSYQGVLTDGAGTPVPNGSYNITFNLYAVASGGTALWTETQSVQVDGGIFSVILGSQTPLTDAFDQPYWLGVSVDGGQEFSPRRELTSAAYSLNTRSIASGQAVTSLNALTDDVVLAPGTNVSITTSTDSIIISSSGGGGSLDWSLTGNAGTTAGTNFMGTTDDQALQFHVNGERALRLEPDPNSPNILAGHYTNSIDVGVWGAVIAGGGNAAEGNLVTDHYGVVGGGTNNYAGDGGPDATNAAHATVAGGTINEAEGMASTVSGGSENWASGDFSTISGGASHSAFGIHSVVGGGNQNVASGPIATIAGGENNIAGGNGAAIGGGMWNDVSGQRSVVGGGQQNVVSGDYATVGGGDSNLADGDLAVIAAGRFNVANGDLAAIGGGEYNSADGVSATIPGGANNVAAGGYSFAAGRKAQANHGGSFVWADSSDNAVFATTANNQFLIRASGGVGIGTNTPSQELEVAGSVKMDGFELTAGPSVGYVLTSDATGQGTWQPVAGGSAWGLSGNAGTTPGTDFLGTTDNQALEFHVNSTRVVRLEPMTLCPNILIGHSDNFITAGVWGAVICGGGRATIPNRATDHYGVIGGGANNIAGDNDGDFFSASYNTIGGGEFNTADGEYTVIGGGMDNVASALAVTIGGGEGNVGSNSHSTIGGGSSNLASGDLAVVGGGSGNQNSGNGATIGGGVDNIASGGGYATIAGGYLNEATAYGTAIGGGTDHQATANHATIAGGRQNDARAFYATVGGGTYNFASGQSATVMGGERNAAAGDVSVAVGFRAKVDAAHDGAILFADSSDFDFDSAAANEFAVRATGGVRLVTGVDGTGTPTAGATLAAGSGTWGSLSDRDAKANFQAVDSDDVLERVAELEITTWNYKAQDPSTRHIGPMAQDFYAAFGLGGDDRRITTVDADGVSLAAIQALNQKLNRALKKKDAKISDLERRIERLESLVLQFSQAQSESAE
jgi:hypothetical protein